MLAPARMPVAAGKKMANTEKNVSPFRKSGLKFSRNMLSAKTKKIGKGSGNHSTMYPPCKKTHTIRVCVCWACTLVPSLYLTLVAEETLCFLHLGGRDEGSHKHIDDGHQQDNQQNDLSLSGKSEHRCTACIREIGWPRWSSFVFLRLPWLPIPYQLLRCPGGTPLWRSQRSWCRSFCPPWRHRFPGREEVSRAEVKHCYTFRKSD